MTPVHSITNLHHQTFSPTPDSKKIQKINETSLAWKAAGVVAATALFLGAVKLYQFYKNNTYDTGDQTSTMESLFSQNVPEVRRVDSEKSTVTWLGDVTVVYEKKQFENDVPVSSEKQTVFSPLFGEEIIQDCRTDLKLNLGSCVTIENKGFLDSRLKKMCATDLGQTSPERCYECNYLKIIDQSIPDFHNVARENYLPRAREEAKKRSAAPLV